MRLITLTISLLTAIVVIALLAKLLPPEAASILLDVNRSTWPLTVQNILWLAFFAGLGELPIRWRAGRLSRWAELPAQPGPGSVQCRPQR